MDQLTTTKCCPTGAPGAIINLLPTNVTSSALGKKVSSYVRPVAFPVIVEVACISPLPPVKVPTVKITGPM